MAQKEFKKDLFMRGKEALHLFDLENESVVGNAADTVTAVGGGMVATGARDLKELLSGKQKLSDAMYKGQRDVALLKLTAGFLLASVGVTAKATLKVKEKLSS